MFSNSGALSTADDPLERDKRTIPRIFRAAALLAAVVMVAALTALAVSGTGCIFYHAGCPTSQAR